MENTKKKNMDMTSGSPLKIIILFTIPIILGNIFQQLYNIGDAKVVSYFIDEHAFGAVGMTAPVSNMVIGLINGFTQGFGILVANAFGAKDHERIRKNVAGAAVLTVCLTTFLLVLSFVVIRPVLVLLNTPDDLMDLALSYVRIILIGIPFSALYNLTANLLRSLGDSRTPLYCLVASIALNIVLDIVFVGVIGMGIEGAALATILSQGICGGACFLYGILKFKEYLPKREDFKLNRQEYGNLFTMGLSMGMMGCIVNIGTIILQSGINGLGSEIVSAHTAGRRLLDILMTLTYTFGFTMTTYTSQNMGAGRFDRVRLGVKTAIGIVLTIASLSIVFAFIFSRSIVTWIASTNDQTIIDNATMYCKVGVCFFPALGPLFVLRCSLQGMGRKVVPIASSILELCIKIMSVLILVPWLGYLGIALTEPISWVLMTLMLSCGFIHAVKELKESE